MDHNFSSDSGRSPSPVSGVGGKGENELAYFPSPPRGFCDDVEGGGAGASS
jgi:hypothetical protein